MSDPVFIGRRLDIPQVHAVARAGAEVALEPAAGRALGATRQALMRALDAGRVIYGVNTGFGALCETRIGPADLDKLQSNLLRSHAAGVGSELEPTVVRALLLLRAHTLALGASGVSVELVERLVQLLNRGVTPVVPSQGSVGASGDLAPLAHLGLPLIGEGEAWVAGQRLPGAEALRKVGLERFVLGPKEGLSLVNGTQLIAALGALTIYDVAEILAAADIVGAMSLDAHMGTVTTCDPRIHAGKPHPGQATTAGIVARLIEGSALNASHSNCGRVQDAYSFRCMPQVHGAVRHAHRYAAHSVDIELNSLTDNPLVLSRPDGPPGSFDVVSGGNFHGATVALPLDHLTAALATLAAISERRVARQINPDTSRGLPPFLADRPGLESGFMMLHVTASALASENKSQSFPATVDSIPTSADQEDHVSMGAAAARKLTAVARNLAVVIAIEAATAARALDLRQAETSPVLKAVYQVVRRYCPPFSGDRSMGQEVEVLAEAIKRGELRRAAGLDLEVAA